ncbi:MAG TPA: PEP-CTERM sorting domain-containing protein [Verrucomicrobiae bacterium]|nr:PEP-CTERM sorting domain-containing protein [Verrucomicrobiae bacterium]
MYSIFRYGYATVAFWVAGCGLVFAQGFNPVVMNTGSGNPLSSLTVGYTNSGSGQLVVDFGFATQETSAPGAFLDSFTISINGPSGTGYIVTLDANGTHWLPAVPGSLPISSSSLQWQSSPFLAPTGGLTNLASYTLGYTLPPSWTGSPLTLNFSLFDNQDNLRSLGYFLVPVAVPEPATTALLALGIGAYLGRRRVQKRGPL